MGSEADFYEASPTPKLSLFLLPKKQHNPPGLSTPPIHTLASVPFKWEEAPGKPRPCNKTQSNPKSSTVRCLELPPRLLNEAKVNNMPSPTTVLDGPDVGRPLSRSLSLGKGRSFENLGRKVSNKDKVIFASSRWGSFRRNKDVVDGSDDGDYDGGTKVKITRVKRRSSFLSFSSSRSHLWVST